MSHEKGKGVEEERNKKWHRKESMQSKKCCPSYKFFYTPFSVTQSFFFGLSWSSDNITASNKINAFKKDPISLSEIAMQYLHKNIVIPLLCQWRLFAHTYVS